MNAYEASNLVYRHRIPVEKDFFTLSLSEVERVLDAANEWKYRKPKQANGSRGRYFFCALQRALRPRNASGFITATRPGWKQIDNKIWIEEPDHERDTETVGF